MHNISITFVNGDGFSNGCAELAPIWPPPFVPKCLIDSSAATGPTAICCSDPERVVTLMVGFNVCGTCSATSSMAIRKAAGRNTRVMAFTKSSKKLPTVAPFVVTARIKAMATHSPVAADVNIIMMITAI